VANPFTFHQIDSLGRDPYRFVGSAVLVHANSVISPQDLFKHVLLVGYYLILAFAKSDLRQYVMDYTFQESLSLNLASIGR
jgi:hypothetical protein